MAVNYQQQSRGGGASSQQESPLVAEGKRGVAEWISNGLNQSAIEFAEKFGKELAQGNENNKHKAKLTTSQIRNVFGEVKRMEMKDELNDTQILLLKSRLAYSAARNTQKGLEGQSYVIDFQKVIDKAIDAIFQGQPAKEEQAKRFGNFVAFFESILAYHRAFGGK